MRFWALLLLGVLLAFGSRAAAEDAALWSRAYGGRGRNELTALADADGTLLAAGYTTSTDGDLSERTREGKTGWLVRLDGEGRILFSCCSAHAGRDEMRAPFAHADGTVSCVLSGENRGCEWLRVNGEGKVEARVEVPERCAHARTAETARVQPCDVQGAAALLLLYDHGDGTLCAAWMDEAGSLNPGDAKAGDAKAGGANAGEAFAADATGCLAVGDAGEAALIAAADGHMTLTRLSASGAPRRSEIPQAGDVTGALMGSDGSVTLCGGSESGGFLLRASAEDEVLFALSLPEKPSALCSTETGFAAAGEGFAVFVDEDGELLETLSGVPEGILALSGVPGGAAVLAKAKNAQKPSVTALRQSVFSAETEEREDGSPENLGDRDEERPDEALTGAPEEETFATESGGMLCCKGDGRGVSVRMIDADGNERFHTRIPITTAADALVWTTALLLDDGGVLLGGHYATAREGQTVTEGVTALLSADGVLRDIRTIEGALGVLSAERSADGRILLHVLGADGAQAEVPLAP